MKPKISIVVPVYNVKDYLEECIDSILNQEFTDYELILVNDGSTDGSDLILNNYKNKDDRIVIINQINQGLSEARNSGIKIAKGEFITFIDSDDWVSKDFLMVLYKEVVEKKAEIVSTNDFWVDQNHNINKHYRKNRIFTSNSADALFGMYDTNYAWGKLMKRQLLDGILFPSGKHYEDIGTMYKIFIKAGTVVLIDRGAYFYRYRSGSITVKRTENDVKDKISFIKEMGNLKLSDEYCYWDFYILNKAFGTLADLYKIDNLDKNARKKYTDDIYKLTRKYKISLNVFKAGCNSIRAWLVRFRMAHFVLAIKYRNHKEG